MAAGKYRTIVADPPWRYDEGFAHNIGGGNEDHDRPLPYEPMDIEDIAALPVYELADRHCRLFLWTTNRWLPDAFDVMCAWRFRYRQMLTWSKLGGPLGGSVAPNTAEFLLVGVRGAPPRMGFFPRAVIEASVPGHSAKPEAFLDYIEKVSPEPRLEMFSRRARFGWSTWGNEALEGVTKSFRTAEVA